VWTSHRNNVRKFRTQAVRCFRVTEFFVLMFFSSPPCAYGLRVWSVMHCVVPDTETGYIIPAVFGAWRKSNKLGYNPFRDIRRNIFKHYDSQSIIRRPAWVISLLSVLPFHKQVNLCSRSRFNSRACRLSSIAAWELTTVLLRWRFKIIFWPAFAKKYHFCCQFPTLCYIVRLIRHTGYGKK